MGALDDAIREHLDLKRRLGAPEEELKRKEDEAFGRGGPSPAVAEVAEQPETTPEPAAQEPASPEPAAEAPPPTVEAPLPHDASLPEAPEPEALAPEPEVASAEPPLDSKPVEEFEPDEVLPEEALEPTAGDRPADDVLEETPEFLEESDTEERLWFEQKPPKDFDFDD